MAYRRKEDLVNEATKLSGPLALIFNPQPMNSDKIDMGRGQLKILFILGKKSPCHSSELASVLSISLPTLSKRVNSLAKQDLVAREDDPKDRRSVYWRISDKGSRLIKGGWGVDLVRAKEVLSRLAPQHISSIIEVDEKILGIGEAKEAKIDYRDSSPRKQRQKSDMIEKVIYLCDRVFLDMCYIMPYKLLDLGIGTSDLQMLQYLYIHKQVPMSSIASWMNVEPPTATGIVDRLVERGLVVRERDLGDLRRIMCRLTDMGQRLVGSQLGPSIEEARSRYETLTRRQLINFCEAVRAMLRAYDEVRGDFKPN